MHEKCTLGLQLLSSFLHWVMLNRAWAEVNAFGFRFGDGWPGFLALKLADDVLIFARCFIESMTVSEKLANSPVITDADWKLVSQSNLYASRALSFMQTLHVEKNYSKIGPKFHSHAPSLPSGRVFGNDTAIPVCCPNYALAA